MDVGTRLTVRAYHVRSVEYGKENRVCVDGSLTVCPDVAAQLMEKGAPDPGDPDPHHPAG